jgi:preprotein translocase subunit SecB
MKNSEFRFLGYRISKIECNISDTFGSEKENIKQEINIENNFNENKFFVEVVLNITIKSDSDNFYFFLKIKGGFQAETGMNEDQFKILSAQNAPAILFPFARAIITNYTAQANIPPIILPTVNFVIPQN